MTAKDSVRTATGTAKESVRHAAEVVKPHAGQAMDTAARYAQEAGARLGPKVAKAAEQARHTAREGYEQYVGPRVAQARDALPVEVERAAGRAAKRTRKAARKAADYAGPRIESAVTDVRAATAPAREEAVQRGAAAVAALRNQVTAQDIEKLARRRRRRSRAGRFVWRATLVGLVAGGAYAAWRWWDRQANPDWLVEPPAATEVADRSPLTSVNGSPAESDGPGLDPQVQAKEDAEKEAKGDSKDGDTGADAEERREK
ncbi:DUF5324 family protein [Streptomyces albus]|uniref:Transcriptional regulator n=1 Tax=Streptomyces albus TaxID=1888 RepID=A0A6C1C337_9ACTN|nr:MULTISPECIES: DUF5324 family protein [Streptomyces]QID37213.1 DUF5324 family protein [Streptomyces albus]TGG81505.1 transcriptional regulator [Streptomyces albus]UVN55847.1 DUF5324 family protein [Streptomyces albus]GHJ23118.1 hypothetical protein TPA0909_47320 [Streptomyces albus]